MSSAYEKKKRPNRKPRSTSGRLTFRGMALDNGGRQRLVIAVQSLEGDGPIQWRLRIAARTFLPLLPRDFPDGEQRELFEQIQADLTKLSGADSDLEATTRGMGTEHADRVASSVVRLLSMVQDDGDEVRGSSADCGPTPTRR